MIEPQFELGPRISAVCEKHSDCEWIKAAIGSAEGRQVFTLVPDTFSSSFNIPDKIAAKNKYRKRRVDIITLNGLARRLGYSPDIVKLDVEGNELKALSAATDILGKTEIFIVETGLFDDSEENHGIVAVVKYMADHGYTPYDFSWFYHRPYDGALGLCDVVFAKKESVLREYKGWTGKTGMLEKWG